MTVGELLDRLSHFPREARVTIAPRDELFPHDVTDIVADDVGDGPAVEIYCEERE